MPTKTERKRKHRTELGNLCATCHEDFEENEFRVVLHKTRREIHSLCVDCTKNFIGLHIETVKTSLNKDLFVKCVSHPLKNPKNSCSKIIDLTKLNLNKPELLYLRDEIDRITIMKIPGATACVSAECRNIIIIEENITRAFCGECNSSWCSKCNAVPHHENISCREHILLSDTSDGVSGIKNLVENGKIRLCPTCDFRTERIDGCNKMSCTNCNDHWCWLCCASGIGYDHFINGQYFDKYCKGKPPS